MMARGLALAVLVVSLPAQPQAAESTSWLGNTLRKLAADPRITPAHVGIEVQELRSGRELFRLHADEQFNVASTAKLITSAAAFAALGAEFCFKTVLYAEPSARQEAGLPATLEGNLYLKGFGNPLLQEQDLWQLVDELYDAGVRTIRGQLIIDESYFDRLRLAPLFERSTSDAWFRPPNGALSLNYNVVSVQVHAGAAPGQPAFVLVRPHSSYLKLSNQVMTVSRARRSWVKVETRAVGDRTEVLVTGRVRAGYHGAPFRKRIEDPGLLAGHALLDLLGRRSIRLVRPRVSRGVVPPKAREVAAHLSEPLAVAVRGMNKHSNNFIAEQLLKVLGAEVMGPPGTSANGLTAVSRYLEGLALRPGTYTLKNGSGLFNATRFSAAQIVTVLRHAYLDFKSGADFVASLAIGGVDGTLAHRFQGSGAERYVRAKTGTLSSVVALSGYAGGSHGRGPLAFAILLNDLPEGRVLEARAVVDEMVAAMVNFLER